MVLRYENSDKIMEDSTEIYDTSSKAVPGSINSNDTWQNNSFEDHFKDNKNSSLRNQFDDSLDVTTLQTFKTQEFDSNSRQEQNIDVSLRKNENDGTKMDIINENVKNDTMSQDDKRYISNDEMEDSNQAHHHHRSTISPSDNIIIDGDYEGKQQQAREIEDLADGRQKSNMNEAQGGKRDGISKKNIPYNKASKDVMRDKEIISSAFNIKLESHQPTGDNSTESNEQQNRNNSVKSHDPKDTTHQDNVKNNSDDQDNTDTQYGLRANSFDYIPMDNETYEKQYSDNIDSTNKTSVILGDKDYSELENSIFGDNDTPKESSIASGKKILTVLCNVY